MAVTIPEEPTESSAPERVRSAPPDRILALDGLRGLAVATIFLYHAGYLKGGYLSLDVFFALSGFLITRILMRHTRRDGRVDIGAFWARRARRLLPALMVMLAVVVPVYATWFAIDAELQPLRDDGLATLFYVANWEQIVAGQDYWSEFLPPSPLRHTWSLAVEEQFYLVWPLVAVALLRLGGPRRLRNVALGGAVAAGIGTIVAAHTGVVSFNALYLSTISRSTALLGGAALAPVLARFHRRRRTGSETVPGLELGGMVALGVLALLSFTLPVDDANLYQWGLAVSTLCAVMLVAAAASPTPGPVMGLLRLRPLRYLGTVSYGIYLWHWPIMQMVDERHTPLEGLPLLTAQVVLTLVAAQVTWVAFERPILQGAIRPPRSTLALVVGTALVAVVVLVSTSGGASDAAPEVQADASGYVSAGEGAPRMLVVGDSVPGLIAEDGIVPVVDELGVSVANEAQAGCILFREVGRIEGGEGDIRSDVTPCNVGWSDQVANYDPDLVMLMFGQMANDRVELDGEFRRPCDPEYRDAQRRVLGSALDDLTSTGAPVVLVLAPWTQVDFVQDAGPVLAERMTCLNEGYEALAAERSGVEVVDLASWICAGPDDCKEVVDGADLRPDFVHFSEDGARVVADWLVPRVLEAADR